MVEVGSWAGLGAVQYVYHIIAYRSSNAVYISNTTFGKIYPSFDSVYYKMIGKAQDSVFTAVKCQQNAKYYLLYLGL